MNKSESKGVITFLDVLGWKGIYNRKLDAISSLVNLINGLKFRAKLNRGRINGDTLITSISDTIVISTVCTDEEIEEAISIHGELCRWAIPYSIQAEIPIRGAISFGEFKIESNIFIGKAVDEAASWHERADWIGVHLTPSAEYVFEPKNPTNAWKKFNPPKTINSWEPYCVNWTTSWKSYALEIKKIKEKFILLGPIVPEIAGKFINTLDFIEKIKNSPNIRIKNKSLKK